MNQLRMATYHTLIGGRKMPSVGLGTWNATDDGELERAIDKALEVGYRHIDTAYLYFNEAVIGRVLKKWFSSGKLTRDDIFITTKLPGEAVHPDKVEPYLKKSLNDLQLDYVDLYLVHHPMYNENGKPMPTDHLAVWKKMEEQVDAGRAKTIGISKFNLRQTKRIWDNARIKPVSLQIEISPYLQEKELVAYCQQKNIAVVGFSTLGTAGFFKKIGKEGSDILSNPTIKEIATKHNKSTAQVILRYFLQKNILMIPKSVTPSRIKENFELFNFSLDSDDVKAMEALDKGEAGRQFDLGKEKPEVYNHPEYPFK